MKGKTVVSIPHPYGTRKVRGWTPEGTEHYQNERAHRREWLSDRQDRTHLEQDRTMLGLAEIDRLHPKGRGGTGLDDYPTLRPMRGHVFARRRSMYEGAKALGIAIPEAVDRPEAQSQGLLYDVLVVGPGVTSVAVGDCVVVNACQGRDMGDFLGEGVWDLVADVPYMDPRTHETETARHPDGTRYTYERPMGDVERGSGGMILAVVEPD